MIKSPTKNTRFIENKGGGLYIESAKIKLPVSRNAVPKKAKTDLKNL